MNLLRAVRWVVPATCAVISLTACSWLGARVPDGATVGCVVESPPDPPPPLNTPEAQAATSADLSQPALRAVARMLVSTSENSSLDWQAQYAFIAYNVEGNATDNRGYTAGIIGFTSRTHDMLELVRRYTTSVPNNPLARYLPALAAVDGTASTRGLGTSFEQAWRVAAQDPRFQLAQRAMTDQYYFYPGVGRAQLDGLAALGQFIYYDAIVMHGPGDSPSAFGGIRAAAMRQAKTPAQGGDEVTYLAAFLDARLAAMRSEVAHSNTSRVDTQQRRFLDEGNINLTLPLTWTVNQDTYYLAEAGSKHCPSAWSDSTSAQARTPPA